MDAGVDIKRYLWGVWGMRYVCICEYIRYEIYSNNVMIVFKV